MELERDVLVSPTQEVPVVEGVVVLAIRALADCGVGGKAIARALGVGIRSGDICGSRSRRRARSALCRAAANRRWRVEARTPYEGPAGGNAVVVQRLLVERGLTVRVRTIERPDTRRGRRCILPRPVRAAQTEYLPRKLVH